MKTNTEMEIQQAKANQTLASLQTLLGATRFVINTTDDGLGRTVTMFNGETEIITGSLDELQAHTRKVRNGEADQPAEPAGEKSNPELVSPIEGLSFAEYNGKIAFLLEIFKANGARTRKEDDGSVIITLFTQTEGKQPEVVAEGTLEELSQLAADTARGAELPVNPAFEVGQTWENPDGLRMTIDSIEDGKANYTTSENEYGSQSLEQLHEWLKSEAITLLPKNRVRIKEANGEWSGWVDAESEEGKALLERAAAAMAEAKAKGEDVTFNLNDGPDLIFGSPEGDAAIAALKEANAQDPKAEPAKKKGFFGLGG